MKEPMKTVVIHNASGQIVLTAMVPEEEAELFALENAGVNEWLLTDQTVSVDAHRVVGGKILPATSEQATAVRWRSVRGERDRLLRQTDWVVTRAAEGGGRPSLEWRQYRQALRDITKQADPTKVVWPTPPAEENS